MNEIQRLQGLLFTLVPGETVRKGSEEPEVYPYGAPERYFSTHFGLPTPPQSTLRVLFVPLFGQFLSWTLAIWPCDIPHKVGILHKGPWDFLRVTRPNG